MKRGSEVVGRYFYDGEGKRIKKQRYAGGTLAEETIFVYSSGKLVAEYSNQVSQTPTVAYTTTDHLGSPRIITNQYGQVKSRRDFLPFGEDIFENVGAARTIALNYSNNPDDLRQKFTGYQKDSETQLDFAEARMYENRFGRFTAVDPLLASGRSANPQTFNRFIYVGNNPIVVTDPSGLDWYRQATGRERDPWEYKWHDKDPGGNWRSVDFGDNVFFQVPGWMQDGTAMGTGYLDRYSNTILTQAQYSASVAAFSPGGGCFANPQCAGLRNPLSDGQSIFEGSRFSSGVPIGVRNQAKALFDVPNYKHHYVHSRYILKCFVRR